MPLTIAVHAAPCVTPYYLPTTSNIFLSPQFAAKSAVDGRRSLAGCGPDAAVTLGLVVDDTGSTPLCVRDCDVI